MSDLKSHIIHGESSQELRTSGCWSTQQDLLQILSDMDKYENTGTEKNRSTAKLECPQLVKGLGVEAVHESCPQRPHKEIVICKNLTC